MVLNNSKCSADAERCVFEERNRPFITRGFIKI